MLMWKEYIQTTSIDEVLQLLAQHRERARLINGGTDLIIEIERKLRSPEVVIDVSRIAGLDEIRIDDQMVRIGAGVTHNQVVAHPLLRERAYALVRACWEVGAPQIRNRGTLAGNLITASPANDTIAPLWALGASVTFKSLHGERTLDFPEFFKGVRRTALEPDEMLTEIAFPLPGANVRSTFLKLGLRRAQAISLVMVAVLLDVDDLNVVRNAQIALGAVAPTIVPASDAEQFLTGKTLDEETMEQAALLATNAARPIDDIRGTAAYRKAMVRIFVHRALRQLHDGTERNGFPERPVMLWGKTLGHFLPSTIHRPPSTLIETTVNGKTHRATSSTAKTLLRFLREDLHLVGTKEGCAEGECGACTVFLDGIAVMSCMVPAARAHGAQLVTIEGLTAAQIANLHRVQRAFVEAGAVQCGYCTPGFIMSGAKLLEENPSPSFNDIQQALTGNLCRCTGYAKIVRAIQQATADGGRETEVYDSASVVRLRSESHETKTPRRAR